MTTVNDMPAPAWTPEAVQAAGGVEPIPAGVLAQLNRFPVAYKMAGELANLKHRDVVRVTEAANRRSITWYLQKGLAMQAYSPSDHWYITFNEPDEDHAEMWFREASGGECELYGAADFEAFMTRFDIPTRATRAEIRNGFRVIVHAAPGAAA